MARTPKEITDAELAVLQLLWSDGHSMIRELVDELYPGGGNSEYATVQKLCERLEAKRFVATRRQTRPYRVRAIVEREVLIGRQLKRLADDLCEGSYVPLINHLMAGRRLSAKELKALRALVDGLEAGRRSRRRPSR